ncbi:MAG: HmuY family protein [Bacteroidota bacterium]|nr:HmuY family protein [Bacteroidota bacterium]
MNKIYLIIALITLLFSCKEDNKGERLYAVSFAVPSINVSPQGVTQVKVMFSQPTTQAGTLRIRLDNEQTVYGVDYITNPEFVNDELSLEFEKGVSAVSFDFQSFVQQQEGMSKRVIFSLVSNTIDYTILSNTSIILNFAETALIGSSLAPEVGGANQPNQVYVDLSSGQMTAVPRTSWDLGFYTGDDYRVILNSSVKMSAKSLQTTDISLLASEDSSMLIGQGAGNASQIDDPSGDITQTAIAAIAQDDAQNQVYLINLGSNPSSVPPTLGSVGTDTGTHRGWIKARILRHAGGGYLLQYANLDQSDYQEIVIDKQTDYNFVFFSFNTQSQVMVEPHKTQWDLNFTTFTNTFEFGGVLLPYFYSDFILNNSRAGVEVYSVSTDDYTYESFSYSDVDYANFQNNQTTIGATWRSTSTTGPDGVPISQFEVFTNLFYIIKDTSGNIYKLKMTQGVLENGERGHPRFVYQLL